MRTIKTILFLLLLSSTARTQIIFKTIIQKSTVEVGESFYVQYTLEGTTSDDGFDPPAFKDFHLVSSPNPEPYLGFINSPDGQIRVKNYMFTLVAKKPGRFIIQGASAKANGRSIKSDDVIIEAVEKIARNENASEYFLQPGEDPYEKMRKNLFMKVVVDKKSCYVGEPVVATFKLYSRLQSKSDIVKNPGFYGFSVQDIVNLENRISNTETIDGKKFDVHTIRMVQLYPLQAGLFMIDAMEVLNKVEFSKSVVNKKPEQEIVEGVHENNDPPANDNNTVTYESSINTDKIAIRVKPYPEKNKSPGFNGATGSFTISAVLEKNDLARNEEGDLIVTIAGKGNFTQLSAPAIQWPAGMEGFEATIKDSLDKTHTPLKGTRVFRFPFVAAKAGSYIIPSIYFSFFETDSNNYRTVSTKQVEIRVDNREKGSATTAQEKNTTHDRSTLPWLKLTALLLVLAATTWWFTKKRQSITPVQPIAEKKANLTVTEILQPAYTAIEKNDPLFYTILQKAIWEHLGITLNLSGSGMNKPELLKTLEAKHLSGDINDILQECEAAAFTKAEFIHDKEELLRRTKIALEAITV